MHHENVVRVLGFGVDDPQRPPCLVMELMAESLHEYLGAPVTPSVPDRLDIINDVVQVRALVQCRTSRRLNVHALSK